MCVYRGTPLWSEYVKRGLVNDAQDWYKYFKCTSIDPTCLPGEEVHRIEWPGVHAYHTAFSPDGRLFLAGGDGGTLRLFDVKTGGHLRDLTGHTHY